MVKNKKYVPDLKKFMATCAKNYAKLLSLVPGNVLLEEGDSISFKIIQQPDLEVSLLQESKYTQTVLLSQKSELKHFNREYIVRLYHDAQVAEVLTGVNDKMLPPVYPVPNQGMKQADEKMQLNGFLGDWLSFCLQFGHAHSLNKTQLAFLA